MEVGYGLTEASPIVTLGCASECPPGSVGCALPGVAIRSASNGELLVRGANVTPGYWNDEPATHEAMDHGWLRTGDRGWVHENGFVYIQGRLKEAMVTLAGETIYPEEAESWYASAEFTEWCVAPVDGPNGNDRPMLFVVPANGGGDPQHLQATYRALRCAAPAQFRVEGMVRLDRPLPRTASGKIKRRRLGEQYQQRLK